MRERGISYVDKKESRMPYLGAAHPKDICYITFRNVYVLQNYILPGDGGQQTGGREKQKLQLGRVFYSLTIKL